MHHGPVIKTAVAAIASVLAVGVPHSTAVADLTLTSVVAWLALGVAYTQFLEYWCHKSPMHRGVALFGWVRQSHLEHHRRFHGVHFQAQGPDDLEHIAGRYWVSPLLFIGHYLLLRIVLPPAAVVVFLAGALAHYLLFEWSHWLTHIDGNRVDRLVARVPWLSEVRARQIEHHRRHHERPDVAFNFNPPYLADRLSASMPMSPSPASVLPLLAEPSVAPLDAKSRLRPIVRYGAAAVVGVAIVGGAAVAWKLCSGAHTTATHSQA